MAKSRSNSSGPQRDGADASDDARLFRAAVRDVKPLPQAPRAEDSAKPRKRAMARVGTPHSAAPRELGRESALESVPAEAAVSGAEALSFRRPGVRTQTLRHLRRGLYPVEDAIDLHGLSQSAARASLAEFLEQSRGAGYHCVRVVHGKGYRSGARGPILKSAVNFWLKRHPDVMAFSSARAIDGGTGAVYVLLRA
jgi:DNA-nicking Smr family endonuclease